mmetsp:Transcript_49510/g.105211  ORF Transcript_49510/g.105211 Transcript_49510/m.105211 type:complete len:136 (+) Transcript_49510:831-1238(+)
MIDDGLNASMAALEASAASATVASSTEPADVASAFSADASNVTSAVSPAEAAETTKSANNPLVQIAPSVPAASVDREEFCQNLARLEAHMIHGLEAENNRTYDIDYEYACSEVDEKDKSFTIDCTMDALDYYGGN